jgi:hypothetical protein
MEIKNTKKKTVEMCNVPDNVLALLQKDVAEIKVALLGNEYNPEGGLLCRTAELEKELEKLKNRYDKMMAYAAGVGGGVSLLIAIATYLLEKII